MIYLLPLEPYDERYTKQWSRWLPRALTYHQADFTIVDSDKLTDEIEYGDVLDAYGTNYYKAGQLMKLCLYLQQAKDGDVILLADGWFPGIEMVQYIIDIVKKDIKIYSIFHAGSYDEFDFTERHGFSRWAKGLEESWFKIYDGIFVGSQWHKDLILSKRECDPDKIHVTGLFFDYKEVKEGVECRYKDIDVVFPHRLDAEKQPQLTDLVNPKPLKTKDLCKTKKEYYKLLGRSNVAISFALQETFGYAMLEAMAMGCHPVVPNKLSYRDTVPEKYRYEVGEYQEMISYYLEQPTPDFSWWLEGWMPEKVMYKMLKVMQL